jgi:hypothetical protein
MPWSRKIVVSKDGYKTASKSVTRADFVEETRRMAATITLTLQKDGATAPAPSITEEAAAPPPSEVEADAEPPAEPSPSEAKAEPAAAPEAVEETDAEVIVAPSETTAADAP